MRKRHIIGAKVDRQRWKRLLRDAPAQQHARLQPAPVIGVRLGPGGRAHSVHRGQRQVQELRHREGGAAEGVYAQVGGALAEDGRPHRAGEGGHGHGEYHGARDAVEGCEQMRVLQRVVSVHAHVHVQ